MTALRSLFLAVVFAPALALAALAQDQDVAGSKDHPLLPRYDGATIAVSESNEFDEYTLITGKNIPASEGGSNPAFESTLPLEGRITHLLYRAPRDRSVLEVFRNPENKWVATSGRTRVVVYSTERAAEDLPQAITDLTDAKYKGRVAWAPTNGSFQAFVTAFRLTQGDAAAKAWIDGMIANDTKVYKNNGTQIEGIANGEVDFGLVNNYYLGRYTAKDAEFPVAQAHFAAGDIGNLVLFAGAGIIEASDNKDDAQAFIDFLLSPAAQQFITLQGNEYPVRSGVIPHATLESLETVGEISPKVDTNTLGDLEGTLTILRDAGLL